MILEYIYKCYMKWRRIPHMESSPHVVIYHGEDVVVHVYVSCRS